VTPAALAVLGIPLPDLLQRGLAYAELLLIPLGVLLFVIGIIDYRRHS